MTSTTWEQALGFVLQWEGGYVNDPDDPGGETKYGISKKAYPGTDIAGLTVERAADIYRRDYWAPCRLDDLPPRLALAVFDGAVHQGVQKAVRLLQSCLGVPADGQMGPRTIEAARRANERSVVNRYLAARAMAYVELMIRAPSLKKYGPGWMRRLFSI